jgi:tRNA(Arg) A34 adenosine deaminase TadA
VYYGCGNERFGGCGSVLRVHDRQHDDVSDRFVSPKTLFVESGHGRADAINLLRRFYLLENSQGVFLVLIFFWYALMIHV